MRIVLLAFKESPVPNCSGPTNMDIEEPQFVRIVLLAFKESPVKGSPFGLSLFVPWIHVKPSPCCRPLCLSGTSMIVDLSWVSHATSPCTFPKQEAASFA